MCLGDRKGKGGAVREKSILMNQFSVLLKAHSQFGLQLTLLPNIKAINIKYSHL